jgi:hypothetical protein
MAAHDRQKTVNGSFFFTIHTFLKLHVSVVFITSHWSLCGVKARCITSKATCLTICPLEFPEALP